MDTASSWGFLGNEEGPGARTRGLTQLGASDGEAWGLVTSPVCVSESERQEEEAAAGQEEPLCSEDSGPQRLVRGRGVSRRQLWRGHSSDLAAQVGPHRPAAHQAPPSLGFSRQEPWRGLPFPSPMQWKLALPLRWQAARGRLPGPGCGACGLCGVGGGHCAASGGTPQEERRH